MSSTKSRSWIVVWAVVVACAFAFLGLAGWVIPWLVQHSVVGCVVLVVILSGVIAYVTTGGN